MVRGYEEDELPTKRGSARLRAVDTVPPENDPATAELVDLGMVMRATQANTAAVNAMRVELGTLSREVTQHSKALSEGSAELAASASHSAARHTSNRMGALFGALVVIWEFAAPYVHQLFGGHH